MVSHSATCVGLKSPSHSYLSSLSPRIQHQSRSQIRPLLTFSTASHNHLLPASACSLASLFALVVQTFGQLPLQLPGWSFYKINWITSLFCSEPSSGFLSHSKEKKKNPNSSSWHPRPHQRGSLASLFVFMSSPSLGLPRLFVPHWPCSCLWDFAVAVPSAWNTLPSSLHKVGSLRVSLRCQCHLLGEVSFPAFPKNTSTSYPRPVTLNPLTRLYFSAELLGLLYITQYVYLWIWLLSVLTR